MAKEPQVGNIMGNDNVLALIAKSIRAEDTAQIKDLIRSAPEQKESYTPFGGQTWLGFAAQVGKLESVKALIELGFDLNAGDQRENRTPICSAAANNHLSVVKFLVESGAYLNVETSVSNPLFAAIVGRSPEIVSLLLNVGIDSAKAYNNNSMKNMDAMAFALMRGEIACAEKIAWQNSSGDNFLYKKLLEEAERSAEINSNR